MKKIFSICVAFVVGSLCFALPYHTGERISYKMTNNFSGFYDKCYVTEVTPIGNGSYNLVLTSICQPVGQNSAVGIFTYQTKYTIKQGSRIVLYYSSIPGLSESVSTEFEIVEVKDNFVNIHEIQKSSN